jgi:HPt (histidine-containing phosphotransfer) domain-containing protein
MKDTNRQTHDTFPLGYQVALLPVGGDQAVREELLSFFDKEFPHRLAEIRRAICEEDGNRVRKAGHALKGVAANLGLDNLRDAGISLEKAGKEYRLHDATWILVRLRAEFTRLKELRQLRGFGEKEPA